MKNKKRYPIMERWSDKLIKERLITEVQKEIDKSRRAADVFVINIALAVHCALESPHHGDCLNV